MTSGTVKFFNSEKGWGFITPDEGGEDIFVHHSASTDPLNEGDKVSYELEDGPRGAKAVNVSKTG
ncbi:MAG TPA: cold shock domain-containing protein [Flavobacteriales bacterium]|jgi:CspA family cold shock protein|nr:cold shock domain-containing protein [Flavobacteriales bacterium]HIO68774.1 cold shock domain-containing protein [Flavobacteriales bacterium]